MAQRENLNIYQKLAKIRKQMEVVQKNKDGFGYKYVSEDELLARISVFMDKYGLSLIPGIRPRSTRVEPYSYTKTKTSKKGDIYDEHVNEVLVSADMTWTWVNNDDPDERVAVDWAMTGQQSDASQAFGSGLTYANRYFLLKYFNVATPEDDPDRFRGKQREAEKAEDRVVAGEIIEEFDRNVKAYLKGNPENAGKVKEFVSRYADEGNYFTIKDSATASRLLSGFTEAFGKGE